MTTTTIESPNPDSTEAASAAWLASRALPHLQRAVQMLEAGDLDEGLGSLSAALTRIRRASHKAAIVTIPELVRHRFPSASALELVLLGGGALGTSYAPKLIVDRDGDVLWSYRLVRAQDRTATDRWESDLAQMCACLLTVELLPHRIPALDPAVEI